MHLSKRIGLKGTGAETPETRIGAIYKKHPPALAFVVKEPKTGGYFTFKFLFFEMFSLMLNFLYKA